MADTTINAFDGTFKTEGSVGMEEARDFLVGRDGLDSTSFEGSKAGSISLKQLYDASKAGGITLAGNAAFPTDKYSLGGLRGASYQNNTAPILRLLGPHVFFVDPPPAFEWNPETASKTSWSSSGSYSLRTWTFDSNRVCKFYSFVTDEDGKDSVEFYDFGTYDVGSDGVAVGTMNFGGSDQWTNGGFTFSTDTDMDFTIPIMDPLTGEPLDQITAPYYTIRHSSNIGWYPIEEGFTVYS